MIPRGKTSLLVDENLRFDARLALYHETECWLAIADLHYGYELSARAHGALFPLWGREEIEKRLEGLIKDYNPATLIFLGDLVHTKAASLAFAEWLENLKKRIPQIVLIRGNHDSRLKNIPLVGSWRSGFHLFHHGDRVIVLEADDTVFSGHLHPTETLTDGAGFRQKLPALCRTETGWILPAFSPWSAGAKARDIQITEKWISNLQKIWKIPSR